MACDTLIMDVIEEVDLVCSDEEVKDEYLSPLQSMWYSYIPDSITALSSRLLDEHLQYSNGKQNTRKRSNDGAQPENEGTAETSSCGTIQVIDLTLSPKKAESEDWMDEALGLVDSSLQSENHVNAIQSDVEVNKGTSDVQVSLVTEGTASCEKHSSLQNSSETNNVQNSSETNNVQNSSETTSETSEATESIDNNAETIVVSNADSTSKSVPEVPPGEVPPGSVCVPSGNASQKRVGVPPHIVAFNHVYPSLSVRARPFLRLKTKNNIHLLKSQRLTLDKMVKELIQKSPAQLIEWCIIQGLINPTQNCEACHSDNGSPVTMNLVQYSNPSLFSLTGGYTWVCSQCKSFQKSVFTGSIFEKSSYPLVTILKLIYHWVNVTDTACILDWVKVEPIYVKHFFSLLRAVCTYAVHEQQGKLGGKSKVVQVGVVSMKPAGTNNKRPLTFLGALDEKCLLRLQLVESLKNGEKCGPEKMVRILKPLKDWIDKSSIICTDFSINKRYLELLGFSVVHQVATCATDVPLSSKFSNVQIKNYLKFQIPNLFKDSIFKLSRVVIQQFLNELTWRERWEQSPLETFTKVLDHIAALTKDCQGAGLVNKLFKMNEDPFRSWSKGAREKSKEVVLLTN